MVFVLVRFRICTVIRQCLVGWVRLPVALFGQSGYGVGIRPVDDRGAGIDVFMNGFNMCYLISAVSVWPAVSTWGSANSITS